MKTAAAVLVLVLLFAWGCASRQPAGQEEAKKDAPNVVFYTFPDIPVPKELGLNMDKSFIYETPNLKAGVLVLSGNVDLASLENYFKVNMAKNGWRFVNSYKYRDIILNFVKEDRASNIRTTRGRFNTQVEIWVGPVDRQGTVQPLPYPKENEFR